MEVMSSNSIYGIIDNRYDFISYLNDDNTDVNFTYKLTFRDGLIGEHRKEHYVLILLYEKENFSQVIARIFNDSVIASSGFYKMVRDFKLVSLGI
jgi:hypothetical protein